MQVIGSALRPGLDVSMLTLDGREGRSSLRLTVRGARGPLRLYVYVDGELVDSLAPAPPLVTFDLGRLASDRHAVTARAVDATGRWGASSVVVSRR